MKSSYPVIGEAAYALMIRRSDVTIASLTAELNRMARHETDAARDNQIHEACRWLMNHRSTETADRQRDSRLGGMLQQPGGVIFTDSESYSP